MKKAFKIIIKLYALYTILNIIAAAALYIYGYVKYGRKMMNEGIKFTLGCYKAVAYGIIYKLNNIKEYIKVRKSPYYVLLDGAKDWEEEFD